MHQIVFVVASDIVESMQIDENPTDSFPCMSTREFHRDARAQLYSLVTGEFLDEAIQMELLDRVFTDDGPYIYRMADPLKVALARLEEDQVEDLSKLWMQCDEIERLNLDEPDLHDFMYQLIHYCQVAVNDDLCVCIYSDD
tara:strand:+ start:840 stop:1262 length:423 start_codon:yes stop_codon:yes gene_type:complete